MPRRCTICAHPEREAIDAALVRGEPYRAIAKRHGVSHNAVNRHRAAHLPRAMLQASAAADVVHGDNLLQQARDLQAKALGILAKAEKAGDLRTAVAANREARGCLELLARLLGEMPDNPSVNIVLAPEWAGLRLRILAALAPYPQARLAVAAALEAGDARD